MNQKLVLGFLAGVIAASGISYLATHRRPPAPAAITEAPPPPPAALPEPVAPPEAPRVATRQKASLPRVHKSVSETSPPAPETPPPAPAPVAALPPLAPPPEPVQPAAPPPPHVPESPAPPAANIVMIPRGTSLSVRLGEGLSSERNRTGDEFTGTLEQPLVVDGFAIAERGAKVQGRVAEAIDAGRVRGLAQLKLELTRLRTADGQNVAIRTEVLVKQGPESKRDDAAKVGLGAALGAIIGAAAGGGKGAAIGAATGGAAGGGVVVATRGKPAVLPVETIVGFRIEEPVTLTEQLH